MWFKKVFLIILGAFSDPLQISFNAHLELLWSSIRAPLELPERSLKGSVKVQPLGVKRPPVGWLTFSNLERVFKDLKKDLF